MVLINFWLLNVSRLSVSSNPFKHYLMSLSTWMSLLHLHSQMIHGELYSWTVPAANVHCNAVQPMSERPPWLHRTNFFCENSSGLFQYTPFRQYSAFKCNLNIPGKSCTIWVIQLLQALEQFGLSYILKTTAALYCITIGCASGNQWKPQIRK